MAVKMWVYSIWTNIVNGQNLTGTYKANFYDNQDRNNASLNLYSSVIILQSISGTILIFLVKYYTVTFPLIFVQVSEEY